MFLALDSKRFLDKIMSFGLTKTETAPLRRAVVSSWTPFPMSIVDVPLVVIFAVPVKMLSKAAKLAKVFERVQKISVGVPTSLSFPLAISAMRCGKFLA